MSGPHCVESAAPSCGFARSGRFASSWMRPRRADCAASASTEPWCHTVEESTWVVERFYSESDAAWAAEINELAQEDPTAPQPVPVRDRHVAPPCHRSWSQGRNTTPA